MLVCVWVARSQCWEDGHEELMKVLTIIIQTTIIGILDDTALDQQIGVSELSVGMS